MGSRESGSSYFFFRLKKTPGEDFAPTRSYYIAHNETYKGVIVCEPFTESEIEEALELFAKMLDECTEDEKQRRIDLLARLNSDTNRERLLDRLTAMATPRDL